MPFTRRLVRVDDAFQAHNDFWYGAPPSQSLFSILPAIACRSAVW
jgi:hypothetical protein